MSSPKPLVYPPLDGSLILPEAVDFNAEHNPDVSVYVYAKDDGSDDIVEISQLEFSRACHRVAHTLRPDREGVDGQVVAVIAVVDTILYQAIVVGIVRAGLVVCNPLVSPQSVLYSASTAVSHLPTQLSSSCRQPSPKIGMSSYHCYKNSCAVAPRRRKGAA